MSYIDQNVWIKNMQDLQNTDLIALSNARRNERKEFIKKVGNRSLFTFFGMIIISLVMGLLVICIDAHAAFSPEGVNQWANVVSNIRGNPSANYERQRMQQMQEEQHELQMELLQEQIRQLKKQKNR